MRFGRVPKREKAKILAAMQSVNARLAEQRTLPAEFADDVQLMQAVIRAHMETCDFTRDKVQLLMADAHRQPNYTACPPTLVSCLFFSLTLHHIISPLGDREKLFIPLTRLMRALPTPCLTFRCIYPPFKKKKNHEALISFRKDFFKKESLILSYLSIYP